ncbi:acyl carrier protein [Glutamicibacter arilaitensis]|uniref:acyl carrier protein n=1 Tax=Glutamicibacter arilaitensis TaxID=256701 RepID=UPI003FD044D7
MSNTTTLRDGFISILTDKFGVPADETTNGGVTLDELGLDSLALVEMLLDLKKKLDVSIEQGVILPEHTLDETVALIEERKGEA